MNRVTPLGLTCLYKCMHQQARNLVRPAVHLKELGDTAYYANDFNTAVSKYTSAIGMDPTNPEYHFKRSMAYLKLGRLHESEKDSEAALNLNPSDCNVLYWRSITRTKLGSLFGAREDVKSFLEFGGTQARARRLLKQIHAAERVACAGPQDTTIAHPPKGYKEANTPGKGFGAFALQPFRKGELILTETPLFTLSSSDENVRGLVSTVNKLTDAARRQFLSLHNCHAGLRTELFNPWFGTYHTNAFGLPDKSVVCLHASRFNHSCAPNAKWSLNAANGSSRIFALREIAPGEEIFVSYLGNITLFQSTRDDRRTKLRMTHAFDCNCAVCSLPWSNIVQSDRRRIEITRISNHLRSGLDIPTRDMLVALKRIILLYREEGYAGEEAECTISAAKMCIHHSDWESAVYWARMAFKTIVEENGIESDEAADTLTLLKPKDHPLAAIDLPKMFTDVRLEC